MNKNCHLKVSIYNTAFIGNTNTQNLLNVIKKIRRSYELNFAVDF